MSLYNARYSMSGTGVGARQGMMGRPLEFDPNEALGKAMELF
jgi:hypothetical protein